MSLRAVLSKVEAEVVPDAEEMARIDGVAKATLARVRKAASKVPESTGVVLGGSYAKGTWVSGHVDLDYFVKFRSDTPLQAFEKLGLAVGESATEGYPRGKMYAQHPYTEATVDGVRVNIVPCFDVKQGEWKSAADRSPFHVELVRGIPDSQKTQVRVLKAFMDGVGVYGAEIQKRGFSGYAAEVLVMDQETFDGALRWFGKYEIADGGRPFTLPDPVDPGRDLGIAVSGESLGRMVLASRGFLRRPRLAYFHGMSGKAHPPLKKEVVALLFSHRALSEDKLWGELRKTTRHLVRSLEVKGFVIARSMAASDNKTHSAILLIPMAVTLPDLEQRVGPTVDRKKDLESFLAANARSSRLAWLDDDAHVRLLVPRKYTVLKGILTDLANGSAGPTGASKELGAGMKKTARVLEGAPLARAAAKAGWLQRGIVEITTDALGTS